MNLSFWVYAKEVSKLIFQLHFSYQKLFSPFLFLFVIISWKSVCPLIRNTISRERETFYANSKQCLLLYTLGRLHEHSGSVGREAGSKIGNEARAFQSAGNGPSAIVVSTAPLAGLPEIYGRKNRQKRRWKKK